MQKFLNFFRDFAREEDGAQAIEYALIVAVLSLFILGILRAGVSASLSQWLDNVTDCLTTGICAFGTPAP
jgi:pilus assembly protein Flp/PilA